MPDSVGNIIKIISASWFSIGIIVIAILLFLPAVTGNVKTWGYPICAIIVFLTGIVILKSPYIFLEVFADDFYDKYKDTADLVKIVRSGNLNVGGAILLGFYTFLKYLLKILFWGLYGFILMFFLFGKLGDIKLGESGELKIWSYLLKKLICVGFAIYAVAFAYKLNLDPENFLLTSEGIISVIIVGFTIVTVIVKAFRKKLFSKEKGRPLVLNIASACVFILLFMLAFCIEAMWWGFADKEIFNFVLN